MIEIFEEVHGLFKLQEIFLFEHYTVFLETNKNLFSLMKQKSFILSISSKQREMEERKKERNFLPKSENI